MTKRERFIAAVRGDIPDLVPVAPLIHGRYAHAVTGRSDWRAVFEVHQMLGSVAFRGPIGVGMKTDALPEGWSVERRAPEQLEDGRTVCEEVIRTPTGALVSRDVWGMIPGDPLVSKRVEYPVKSPGDWQIICSLWEQVLTCCRGPDTGEVEEANSVMGQEGVPSVGLGCAFARLGAVRGMQEMILDLKDEPRGVLRAFELAEEMTRLEVEAFLVSASEVAWMDICWATGANLGARTFERWVMGDVRRAAARVRQVPGKYLGVYTLGRIRELLPMLADAGIHFVETFEPNQGDITLAEAKRLYGNRVCVMGNFNCLVLSFGSVADAQREALRCLREGMAGGGYVMVTADEVPADAKSDNLRAMVETVEKHGRY